MFAAGATLNHPQQPARMDEDQAYLDYLGGGHSLAGLALRGTQPDNDPESSDSQRSGVHGRAFAAMTGNYKMRRNYGSYTLTI